MSGFALIFNRDLNEPAAPDVLSSMLSRLAHRGPDGEDALLVDNVGLGHAHFWLTPEDVGVRQPLSDPTGQFHILFDGRLDNRAELLAALGMDALDNRALPDAELVLQAYLRWGEGCFRRLLGPLAVAIVDRVGQRVILARDALGSRSLFYYVDARVLVAASEPYAVLAHPAVSADLNENAIVRWYAVMAPEMGTTFFADVHELCPAHVMVAGTDQVRQWRYWEIDPARRLRYRSDAEYAEHFRCLLTESVRSCLRSSTPVAVSMSGGFDSTSVAALSALELASRQEPERLLTVSWIFDELPECDERPSIETMNGHFNTVATLIPGDDAWPLRDWENWPHNPNMPEGNAYRLLKMRLYQAACKAGARVVLTGAYGNELLGGSEYWLIELLADGRLSAAVTGLLEQIRWQGLRHPFTQATLFRVASRSRDVIPGARQLRPRRKPAPPAWLTPYARAILADQLPESWPPSAAKSSRQGHHQVMLGSYATTGGVMEITPSAQAGIDLRYPYHDQRLVEFALALPAYMMHRGRRKKYITHEAMIGILPDSVRATPRSGLLGALYKRGLLEKERSTLDELLTGSDTLWQRYVQPDIISKVLERLPSSVDDSSLLIPWFCASMEMWRIKMSARSSTPSSAL